MFAIVMDGRDLPAGSRLIAEYSDQRHPRTISVVEVARVAPDIDAITTRTLRLGLEIARWAFERSIEREC